MPVKLNSTGGGSVTVTAANTASDYTLTAPARTGTIITSADSGSITSGMLSTGGPTWNSNGAVALLNGVTNATGTGITFPAAQSASTDANTLDDYEEGTFTPTLASGFSSGPTSYTTQLGSYVKIGRLVYVQVYIDPNGATASAAGVTIGGLPFTSAANTFGGCYLSYQNNFNTNATDTYHISANASVIGVYDVAGVARAGNAAGVNINNAIILVGFYQT